MPRFTEQDGSSNKKYEYNEKHTVYYKVVFKKNIHGDKAKYIETEM